MPKLSANGIAIHYELTGPENGPVVTMSHSLAAHSGMWAPQVPALVGRGYRVLRYDTRGHGQSEVPAGPYTLEMLAEDVIALLQGLGIAKTHFVGLSMGGMIGQTLALMRPDLLHSLVLCDTSSGYPPEAAAQWQERIAAAKAHGLEPNVEPTLERWFSPGFAADNRALMDTVRAMIRNTPVEGFVGCCHAIAKLDLTERISDIRTPTLIIVGEDDPGTPVAMSRTIQERIEGSELVVIPVARHLSNMEAVEPFNAALLDFLGRHR